MLSACPLPGCETHLNELLPFEKRPMCLSFLEMNQVSLCVQKSATGSQLRSKVCNIKLQTFLIQTFTFSLTFYTFNQVRFVQGMKPLVFLFIATTRIIKECMCNCVSVHNEPAGKRTHMWPRGLPVSPPGLPVTDGNGLRVRRG